jgi:SAM-dependent methyltransferase
VQEQERYRMMARRARSDEAADWADAGIRPGARVADIGCGPGAVLRLLAEEAGPSGRVDGVDSDGCAVAVAHEEIAGLPQASVRRADATATGLEPRSYDVVMCRHVLAHNGGRERAIVAHMAALVRPGGALYLVDADVSAIWMLPRDPDLADLHARYIELHRWRGNDIMIGRSLGALLEAAGTTVETFRTGGAVLRVPAGLRSPAWAAREALLEAGLATDEDVDRWDAAFGRLDTLLCRPWMGVPTCLAVGRVAG